MTTCEMCGSESNSLVNVQIAGSTMSVCNLCKGMGKEIEKPNNYTHTFKKRKKEDSSHKEVVSNYPALIQKELAKKNLTVMQLARATNIKESSLNNYLKKSIILDVSTARKIENFLGLKLVYEVEDDGDFNEDDFIAKSENSSLSLGDLIKEQLNKK